VNQAYLLGGNVLALQFHLEAEAEIIREMIAHEGHELAPAETPGDARAVYIQRASAILGQLPGSDESLEGKKVLGLLLNRFLNV
jgi:hypothetical protein